MNYGNPHALLYTSLFAAVLCLAACGGSNSAPTGPQLPPDGGVAFVSTAPTQASEGSVYTYSMQANVTGATFSLTSSPTGATLTGSSVTWTPTAQQARTANQFSVTATYGGSSATQSWSVTPNGNIRGTFGSTCITDSGQVIKSNGLVPSTVQALVPNQTNGFDKYSGTTAQDGSFSLPNVPAGSFWLIAPPTNLWTSSSTVDLGYRRWGGCHSEQPSSQGTSLAASVTGLNPWQYDDYFYFAVPNARTAKGAIPSVGDTSLSFAIPNNNLLLMDAANGDNGYFAQLVTATYSGIEFHALKNFAGPVPITITNGSPNSVAVLMQPLAQSNTVRGSVRGSAFVALHDKMFPGAVNANPGFNFRVDISADKSGPASNGLFLVYASYPFTTDIDAGDVQFANPYPSAWTPFLDYTDMAIQYIRPAGAIASFPYVLFSRVVSADLPTAANPITPVVGPALNPTINGVSLFNDQVISGTTPTLAWQPPSVGTASGYIIQVEELVVNNGQTSVQPVTWLTTTSTSAMLPPGLLSSGKAYHFVIRSVFRKGIDLGVSPNLEAFPEGESELASGIVSVQ